MKREDYIGWEEYFMGVAELSARRSKDPKTQVGACIINPDNKHILSIGYNGLPRGMNDDNISWEDESDFLKNKHTYVVHAEANAILNANTNIEGSSMYITMFPCNECAKLIVQSGVKELFYKDDKFLYKPQGIASKHILTQGGVIIKKYKEEKN